jgi:hypothetical protein
MRRKIDVRAFMPDPRQPVFSGVAPVTASERLTWLAGEPMRAPRAQRPLDIGFWDPMRNQIEMF